MTRQEIHELVDEVPDEQLDSVAAFIVEVVASPDDEPLSARELGELDQGLKEARGGEGRPLEDVLRDMGL
jgi:hypothetical protein